MTDHLRFEELSALSKEELHVSNGVGTLSEKYLHIFLKNYLEPDKSCHEVKVGRFTADILNGNHITEIQTRSLNLLREKLEYYLLEGYEVTVVHPVVRIRKMINIDAETGEILRKSKFAREGNFYDGIPELYKLKYFLDRENFEVRLILFDIEEYREMTGGGVTKTGKRRRRRSKRTERIPFDIGDSLILDNPADYLEFVPKGLEKEFLAADFARCAGISLTVARMTLNLLTQIHVTEHIRNEGRKYVYRLNRYFDYDNTGEY